MTGPKRRIVDFRSLKGYAEEHLPEKLHFPSVVLELGRKYPQIFPQLLSRSEGNYVIISHVGSFCGFFVRGYFTTSNNWNRFFAYFTSKNSYHPIKQGLSLFLGVKNWGYSKIAALHLRAKQNNSILLFLQHTDKETFVIIPSC